MSDCNWYYDLTEEQELSHDPEHMLVWLCSPCVKQLNTPRPNEQPADQVQFASSDSLMDGDPCWLCNA